jgi:hypothetical protein
MNDQARTLENWLDEIERRVREAFPTTDGITISLAEMFGPLPSRSILRLIETGREWLQSGDTASAERAIVLAEQLLRKKLDGVGALVTGRKVRDALKGAQPANVARHARRDAEWTKWRAEADAIRATERGATMSLRTLARHVKKRLQLRESEHTIRARLK